MIRTTEKIYIDYNPSEESWIDTEIIGSEDVDVVTLMWKDNEAISPNIVKELEKRLELSKTSEYWKNWCDVYIYGKLGQLEGTIFNNWKIVDKIPDESKLIGFGCDFGYSNDPSTLIGVYKLNENDLYIDELIYQTQLTNTDLGKKIKQLELPNLTIYADSSNPGGIEEIRRMGINIQKVGDKTIKLGIDILQRYNIFITSKSVNTIKEFRMYKWEVNNNGTMTNTPASGYDHSIDAIRYLAMMKLKVNKSGIYNTITI
jgi:phage terminase large subunit